MSNERVVVKFTQSWRGYSKGERAGFDSAQAKALIDGKVAEAVKAVKAAPAVVAPKAAAGKANGGGRNAAKPAADTKPADPEAPPPTPENIEPEDGRNTQSGDDDDEPKP